MNRFGKLVAVLILLLSIPSLIYGTFSSEFVRFVLTLMAVAFTFFHRLSWILRWSSAFMCSLVLGLIEYILWRELIYQVGCFGKDLC